MRVSLTLTEREARALGIALSTTLLVAPDEERVHVEDRKALRRIRRKLGILPGVTPRPLAGASGVGQPTLFD